MRTENDRRVVERIGTGKAAAICGFTPKTMRKLAANGTIPGAAFLGNNWRFDERRLRDWIRQQEAAHQKQARSSSSWAPSDMHGNRFMVEPSDEAYERLLGLKPKSSLKTDRQARSRRN